MSRAPTSSGRSQNPSAPSSGIPYGHVPAYLPGSASLVEELDQPLMVVLRDGRHLVGTLRSFDQFSNMVMENTSERLLCCKDGISYYSDIPLGLYVVRGDSMVLLGKVGDIMPNNMKKVEQEELQDMIEEMGGTGGLNWDFDADLTA